jgi:hypothetical protein
LEQPQLYCFHRRHDLMHHQNHLHHHLQQQTRLLVKQLNKQIVLHIHRFHRVRLRFQMLNHYRCHRDVMMLFQQHHLHQLLLEP